MSTTVAATTPAEDRTEWYRLSAIDSCRRLGVDPGPGLTAADVAERRAKYGPNRLAQTAKEPGWKQFLRQYRDLMQLVLVGAAVVSIVALQDVSTGLVVLALTVVNAIMGLHQEGKAAESVAALSKMLIMTAHVRRDGQVSEVPAEELVPGDIVGFEAGDKVPADGRILVSATLEIEEAGLTGESTPVSKVIDPVDGVDVPLGDRIDMAYMNSQVTRGRGEMVVTATGMATEVGHISGMLSGVEQEKTPLTKQLDQLTMLITILAGGALVAIILLGLARGEDFDSLFLVGISLAIAAIPTGLPAVVTMLLSTGTQQLASKGAIVKRLRSVETLGSTSAICSDKTGTLTLNQMTARALVVAGRRFDVDGEGYSTQGRIMRVAGSGDGPLEPFLLPMALANDAVIRDGACIGDPTEGALVVLAEKGGLDVEETRRGNPRLAEVPFDAEYKFMATFHELQDGGRRFIRCLVKGAPDVLLARSSRYLAGDGSALPLAGAEAAKVLAENDRLAGEGMRVLAVARRDFERIDFDATSDLLGAVTDLDLLALIGIVDPPRKEAKVAIAECKRAGIRVRMITGDHATTAAAIAGQLGIEGRALTGTEFAAMSDDQLDRAVKSIGVVARVAPEDKVRLVGVLKKQGNVVAMTGDGVNDAPALVRADIGVAMGITGTEVTKDAAEMILTDDNFATIVTAVESGRGLYDNLMKYVRVQMIMLAGFILTFLGAGIFTIANGTPLLPLQILWINFAIDVLLAVGLGFDQPTPGLMNRRPRPPDEPVIRPAMGVRLALDGLLIAIGVLVVVAVGEDQYGLAVATTMGLTVTSLLHIVAAVEWRDPLRTIFTQDTLANGRFIRLVLIAAGLTFVVTTVPGLQRIFDTVDLSSTQWGICLLAPLAYLVLAEVEKVVVRRRDREDGGRDVSREGEVRVMDRRSRIVDGLRVRPGAPAGLAERDTRWSDGGELGELTAPQLDTAARALLEEGVSDLSDAQELLWASDRYALLVVFQAMDAAGKDSAIEHVMSGVNPQGVDVVGFRKPSAEELDHTFLWRIAKAVPERGRIGIFNRSHYEEVIALRVHPEWLEQQKLPAGDRGPGFWADRYEDINAFERHLDRNGTKIVKLFLQVSKDEQHRRFMARLDNPNKEWKFNAADVAERARWDDYQAAYESALTATSTDWAPWYVVPADQKSVTQALVGAVILEAIQGLDLRWPVVSDAAREANASARLVLEAEPTDAPVP